MAITKEQADVIKQNWDMFVQYGLGCYLNDDHNIALIGRYLQDNGIVTPGYNDFAKAIADPSVEPHLHIKTVEISAAEKATKAEADRKQKLQEQNDAVFAAWIKNECPKGLITSNGDLYPTTIDKLVEYVTRNYPGKPLTAAMLSEATTSLAGSLDWFSMAPEDRELRNQPAPVPKERNLSAKALEDAGMKVRASERRGTHEDDGEFVDPNTKLREFLKKVTNDLGTEDPMKSKCEELSVTNRYRRTDYGFVAKMKQNPVKNPNGSINWSATYKKWSAECNQYERLRNRD